jgi:hypothetical protein
MPNGIYPLSDKMTLISILLVAAVPAMLPHRLCTLLPSAALSVLIALVIIFDVPFQGQSAVRPGPNGAVADLLPRAAAHGATDPHRR